ncbi:DUF6232 family protein [Erwinia mallotivora]|uniref:DUF6232 family protein n=1 Tax=Erwinia mallotivora TaxID=69222 RepID=UPI0021BFDBB7|nr:DUF6232 family protein [Erwinia mallotivora]
MEEVEFYNDGSVSVTSARFRVGSSTYAMQGVTSVKRGHQPANKLPAVIMGLVGLVMMFVADQLGVKAFGGLMLIAGIALFVKLKPEYSVYLNSSSGESQALQSKDRAHIDKVIDALNQSIVHRG